jgi:DNA polymerase III subunit delta
LRIALDQLAAHLARDLKPSYWISGDEPLLVAEASDAVRAAARARGFTERQVFFVARYFDWDELRTAAQSLSLFAERRILEIRMPSGKPDAGAAVLIDLIERPPPDVLTLIVTDKLDKKTSDSGWARAAESKGAGIHAGAIDRERLPQWLLARAAQRGVQLETAAAELIAERAEGHLLAADQEITKLALLAGGSVVDLDRVMNSVGDSARYDVYQLAAAAAQGDGVRALHILAGLRAEGTEPTLILWAMTRELRGVWQALERRRLNSNARGSPWNLASPASPQIVQGVSRRSSPLARLLEQAGTADRIIKGGLRGDAWAALTALVAGFAGALPRNMISGRMG